MLRTYDSCAGRHKIIWIHYDYFFQVRFNAILLLEYNKTNFNFSDLQKHVSTENVMDNVNDLVSRQFRLVFMHYGGKDRNNWKGMHIQWYYSVFLLLFLLDSGQ